MNSRRGTGREGGSLRVLRGLTVALRFRGFNKLHRAVLYSPGISIGTDTVATDVGVVKVLTFEGAHGPRISNLALTIISALLLVLAFPPFEYSLLAWVALAPLILASVRERRWVRVLLFGEAAGSIFFYGTCWWITHPMIHYGGIHPVIAYVIAVVPALILGFFPAVFVLLLSRIALRFGSLGILAAPFLWVGTEALRSTVTGMPWNLLGYSQAFTPALIQPATIGGVYAIDFLLVLVASLLAYMAVVDSPRRILLSGLALVLIMAANYCWGKRVLAEPPASRRFSVIAVQPNLSMPSESGALTEDAALAQLSAQSAAAIESKRQPDSSKDSASGASASMLLVWPESPMNFEWFTDPAVREVIKPLVARYQAHLLLNSVVESPEEKYYNSVLAISPSGEVVSRYDKLRLLPFGEYVPLRRFIPFIGRVPALAGDFTAGDRNSAAQIGGIKVASSICFEAAFPNLSREAAQLGASLFVNVTDDAWFGTTPEPRQHLAHAVFRCVENRRAMARVANTGYSALIGPDGQIADLTELFKTEARVWNAEIVPPDETTFFTRHGEWLSWLCVAVTLGVMAMMAIERVIGKRIAVINLEHD